MKQKLNFKQILNLTTILYYKLKTTQNQNQIVKQFIRHKLDSFLLILIQI